MIALTARRMMTSTSLYWKSNTSSNADTTSSEWLTIGTVEWIESHGDPPKPSEESDAAEEPAIVERPIRYGPARRKARAPGTIATPRLRGVIGRGSPRGRPKPSYIGPVA